MKKELQELIYGVQHHIDTLTPMQTIDQQVQGVLRPCCALCGSCPSALLEKLKELLEIVEHDHERN